LKPKGFNFNFKIRVRWSEVDPQEIVFNAKYLEYGEITVSEYYRNLGIKLYNQKSREYFDTALVKSTIEFKQSAKVEDILHIFSRITKIGKTSITQEIEIYNANTEEHLTSIELIYVDYDSSIGKSRVVPDKIRSLIEDFEKSGSSDCFSQII
tara:strand:- start:628 stop:1086 length:459 start_codon:yes stop_codon:yes gene_type:complete